MQVQLINKYLVEDSLSQVYSRSHSSLCRRQPRKISFVVLGLVQKIMSVIELILLPLVLL